MSDERPARWLIEFDCENYVVGGFGTPEAAIKEWAKCHNPAGCFVKISKLGPTREFRATQSVTLEPA